MSLAGPFNKEEAQHACFLNDAKLVEIDTVVSIFSSTSRQDFAPFHFHFRTFGLFLPYIHVFFPEVWG